MCRMNRLSGATDETSDQTPKHDGSLNSKCQSLSLCKYEILS